MTEPLRDRLRAALPVALKARDRATASTLRSTLAAIENAEAVDAGSVRAGAVEASAVGIGVAEAERRVLTEEDVVAIVRAEIAERSARQRSTKPPAAPTKPPSCAPLRKRSRPSWSSQAARSAWSSPRSRILFCHNVPFEIACEAGPPLASMSAQSRTGRAGGVGAP